MLVIRLDRFLVFDVVDFLSLCVHRLCIAIVSFMMANFCLLELLLDYYIRSFLLSIISLLTFLSVQKFIYIYFCLCEWFLCECISYEYKSVEAISLVSAQKYQPSVVVVPHLSPFAAHVQLLTNLSSSLKLSYHYYRCCRHLVKHM